MISYPLIGQDNDFLDHLKIPKQHLLELISRGRIQFALPQNIIRYNLSFLEECLNTNPECIILSRRLASSSIIDIRNKTGFLATTFSFEEKIKCSQNIEGTGWQNIQLIYQGPISKLALNGDEYP